MRGHFSVKNFEKHQHYKDRRPPWIKLYNDLLEDYAFCLLPDASKWHLVAIWLLASRYENKIPMDERWVSQQIGATAPVNLDALIESGFLIPDQVCSKTLAKRLQLDIPETETQVKTETETLSLRSSVPAPPKRKNKSSLPENFPDGVSRKWAETLWLQKGRADLCGAMDDEAAKFRDHHTANNKSSADWAGSWRTWARNAINFSRVDRNGRGNGNGKLSAHQKFAAAGLSIIRDAQRRAGDGDNDPVGETQRPLLET